MSQREKEIGRYSPRGATEVVRAKKRVNSVRHYEELKCGDGLYEDKTTQESS